MGTRVCQIYQDITRIWSKVVELYIHSIHLESCRRAGRDLQRNSSITYKRQCQARHTRRTCCLGPVDFPSAVLSCSCQIGAKCNKSFYLAYHPPPAWQTPSVPVRNAARTAWGKLPCLLYMTPRVSIRRDINVVIILIQLSYYISNIEVVSPLAARSKCVD